MSMWERLWEEFVVLKKFMNPLSWSFLSSSFLRIAKSDRCSSEFSVSFTRFASRYLIFSFALSMSVSLKVVIEEYSSLIPWFTPFLLKFSLFNWFACTRLESRVLFCLFPLFPRIGRTGAPASNIFFRYWFWRCWLANYVLIEC